MQFKSYKKRVDQTDTNGTTSQQTPTSLEEFVPYLNERDSTGKITTQVKTPIQRDKKQYVKKIKSKRLKLNLEQREEIQPKQQQRKVKFLKELSQGGSIGPTSKWEKVSLLPPQWKREQADIRDLNSALESSSSPQGINLSEQHSFKNKFVKKEKYIDRYSNVSGMNSGNHLTTGPSSCNQPSKTENMFFQKRVYRGSGYGLSPPVGYYNIQSDQEIGRRTPMLVNMAKSAKHWRTQSTKTYELLEPFSAKLADDHDISPFSSQIVTPIDKNPLLNVTEKHLKQKLSLEYDTIREKQRFIPSHQQFDPSYLNNFTKNIDLIKKKIRLMKNELATWTDKQVTVMKAKS